MEVIGGIILGITLLALLAALGITTVLAFAIMGVLGIVTEISFKRLFFISYGVALLAPILLGAAAFAAFEDGELERDLRDELSDVIQIPADGGENWSEVLPELQDLSRDRERGNLSDEEAERRLEEILSRVDDLQITIDIDGDGVVIDDEGASGVQLQLPEPETAPSGEGDGER